MDKQTLEARLATAEQSYNDLGTQIQKLEAEQFRLQGEHRFMRDLLDKMEAGTNEVQQNDVDTIAVDTAPGIEVKEEASDGTTTTE